MTLVSLLGAFGLLLVAGWQLNKSYEEDEIFGELLESSGTASSWWRRTNEVLNRGRNVILAMDFFTNELSGLFGFVEKMLDDMGEDINLLKTEPVIPRELIRKLEKTFAEFKETSSKLGAIAVAAYSYMALVPLIQPPIMRALTSEAERSIEMVQLRQVLPEESMSGIRLSLSPVVGSCPCPLRRLVAGALKP